MAKVLESTALNAAFLDAVNEAKDDAETAASDALAILEGGEHSTEGTISADDSVEGRHADVAALHADIEDNLLPAAQAAAADPILAFRGLSAFETDELDYVLDSSYVSAITETNCTFDADNGTVNVTGSAQFVCVLRVTLGDGGPPNPMYLTEYLSWFLNDTAGVWTDEKVENLAVTLTLRNSSGTVLETVTISEKSDQGVNLKGAFEVARGAAYYAYLQISGETSASVAVPVGSFYPSRYPANPYLTLPDGDGRYAKLKPTPLSLSANTNIGTGHATTETVYVTTGGITLTLQNASALSGRTITFVNKTASAYSFAPGSGVTLRYASGLGTSAVGYGTVLATFDGTTVHLSGDLA